jgi:putative transcriptional regulator
MPIVVKLDDMLHARRMTLTELAERIGITLANLSILKTGKARAVRFSTLEAICDVMQCQPGDPLEYAPSSVAESGHCGSADHVFRRPPAAQTSGRRRSRGGLAT